MRDVNVNSAFLNNLLPLLCLLRPHFFKQFTLLPTQDMELLDSINENPASIYFYQLSATSLTFIEANCSCFVFIRTRLIIRDF